jgi:hypothetical protein
VTIGGLQGGGTFEYQHLATVRSPSEDAVLNALSRLSGLNFGHSQENEASEASRQLLPSTTNQGS